MPAPPKFPTEGWAFGKPDVILPMTEEASVPADGVVAYRHFAVPTNFTEDTYIQAAEIKRGDPARCPPRHSQRARTRTGTVATGRRDSLRRESKDGRRRIIRQAGRPGGEQRQ